MNRILLFELVKSCLWNLQIDKKMVKDMTDDEYQVYASAAGVPA